MKVKYKQPVGILSCSNADFEFDIHLKVTNDNGTEYVFFICFYKFSNSSKSLIDSEYDQWAKN